MNVFSTYHCKLRVTVTCRLCVAELVFYLVRRLPNESNYQYNYVKVSSSATLLLVKRMFAGRS